MHWLEMLKLSSPSTCLSVVLNLDVNEKNKQKKKNSAGIGEDLCLIVTVLPKMDVGVSKSHVFLNYSPRALFSQWDVHLHGAARGLLAPALVPLWAYLQCILCGSCSFSSVMWCELNAIVQCLTEWLEVAQLHYLVFAAVVGLHYIWQSWSGLLQFGLVH